MNVIVDTSVWSLALRRKRKVSHACVALLENIITDGRVALLGAIRQEILCGIRHSEQFERLKLQLRAFPDLTIAIEDYELAAEFYNLCRKKGIQGSNTDFLICAAATHREYEILTTDQDFQIFAKHIPLRLTEF